MKNSLRLDQVVLLGRTFEEYCRCFCLKEKNLQAEKILDMGGGVSSFCAEARSKGLTVWGADPIYAYDAGRIERQCRSDLEAVMTQMPQVSHKYKWNFYQDISHLKTFRERAYQGFMKDFKKYPQGYHASSLPATGFQDNQFTLSLVSHYLFMYEDKLTLAFHKKSLLELLRITSKELRIYPLVNMKGEKCSYVAALMADADFKAYILEERPSEFEFLQNANQYLSVRKT